MSDGDAPRRGDGNTNDREKFVETAYQRETSASPQSSMGTDASTSKDPLIGTTVSGYVMKGKIGSGGMGIVYEGEHPVIGKRVAIKVLRPEIAENPEQVKRLVDEARAVNTVGHRGIIDVFGFGEVSDGRQCIVMEFLDGEALVDLLARNQREHRAMAIDEVMGILEEMLSALGAAHGSGVIHRDLKPSNIFLCRQRDGSRYVKILDFGIAKLGVHGATPQTHASMLIGTPSYMAPEQARGGLISPSLDLYSVGVIAFEMVTGQLPFLGGSVVEVLMKHAEEAPVKPSTLLMGIPDEVDGLLLKLLAKKPTDRYPTAEAVRIDVVRIRSGLMESTARRPELGKLQTVIIPNATASALPRFARSEALSETLHLPRAISSASAQAELAPRSKAPLLATVALGMIAAVVAVFYFQPQTSPTVIALPVPNLRPLARPAPLKALEPVVAPAVVVQPPEPLKEPTVAMPAAGASRPAFKPRKDWIERFTRIEMALAKRADKQTELKTARKFLEKLKQGTVTAAQHDQIELAARRLEDSLTE